MLFLINATCNRKSCWKANPTQLPCPALPIASMLPIVLGRKCVLTNATWVVVFLLRQVLWRTKSSRLTTLAPSL